MEVINFQENKQFVNKRWKSEYCVLICSKTLAGSYTSLCAMRCRVRFRISFYLNFKTDLLIPFYFEKLYLINIPYRIYCINNKRVRDNI